MTDETEKRYDAETIRPVMEKVITLCDNLIYEGVSGWDIPVKQHSGSFFHYLFILSEYEYPPVFEIWIGDLNKNSTKRYTQKLDQIYLQAGLAYRRNEWRTYWGDFMGVWTHSKKINPNDRYRTTDFEINIPKSFLRTLDERYDAHISRAIHQIYHRNDSIDNPIDHPLLKNKIPAENLD